MIDESFDQIDNAQDRIARIVAIVRDLCRQDLLQFLHECESVCKYNQQHLQTLSMTMPKDFPDKFFAFINDYKN